MAAALERRSVIVRPTGAALGADLDGVDLGQELSQSTIDAIKQAWSDHLVLRFRGQHLDDDQLMRFSALFGELDFAPVIAASRVQIRGENRYVDSAEGGHRYISIISNIVENGVAIGALGAYEAIWHTDMSYNPEPPIGSALYALEVPPAGGDTGFANMYMAYNTLPEQLRRQVAGRLCRHEFEPQQRRRIAPRLYRCNRSARGARRRPPDRPHPSGDRTQGAVSRSAAQCLCPGLGAQRQRAAARCAVGACHRAAADLVSAMAGRRPRAVGQSLRHAPPRRVRPDKPAADAPVADQGRPSVLKITRPRFRQPARGGRAPAHNARRRVPCWAPWPAGCPAATRV